jgi:hypothetical protein
MAITIVSIKIPSQPPQRGGEKTKIRARVRKAPFGGWEAPFTVPCTAKATEPTTNLATVLFAEWIS